MQRHPLRWWALATAIFAVLVDMIDNQIVAVALPTIQRELVTGQAALQWIAAGYALGFALTLITGGRLGDRYGTRRLFLAGMAVFTAASLAAGLAPHVGLLLAGRVVQGIGSGLMVPQVLSFVHAEFDQTERGRALALFAGAFPVGGTAGPLLGGVLTEADLFGTGWRAVFLVNVPIGVLALVGALLTMPARPGRTCDRMDLRGLALLTGALFALFYPLVQGRQLGWPWWSIVLLVGAVPLFGLFALAQRATARRAGQPLIPPGLLGRRGFGAAPVVLLCVNAAVGVFFVLTLHLQLGLGYSPWDAAVTFLPIAVGIVLGNVLAIRLAPRFGRRFTAVMVALVLVSLAAMAALIVWLGAGLTALALAAPAVGLGLGVGSTFNALFGAAMAQVSPDQAGATSGIVNTAAQLGMAAGTALIGTVYFARLGGGSVTATAGAIAVSVAVLVLALLATTLLPRTRSTSPAVVPEPAANHT